MWLTMSFPLTWHTHCHQDQQISRADSQMIYLGPLGHHMVNNSISQAHRTLQVLIYSISQVLLAPQGHQLVTPLIHKDLLAHWSALTTCPGVLLTLTTLSNKLLHPPFKEMVILMLPNLINSQERTLTSYGPSSWPAVMN